MREPYVTVARVGAPHGIRGALKLQVFIEEPQQLFDFKNWFIKSPQQNHFSAFDQFELSEKGGQFYITFNATNDRDEARRYTHSLLAISSDVLPDLGPDEFYWSELEGLSVYNVNHQYLGKVDHLLETGANDVLVIKNDRVADVLIPYVYPEIVKQIDLDAEKIIVDWEE